MESKSLLVDNPDGKILEEVDSLLPTNQQREILRLVPAQYHKFTFVFSKQLANILPKHCKFDIGIDTQTGKRYHIV